MAASWDGSTVETRYRQLLNNRTDLNPDVGATLGRALPEDNGYPRLATVG
jgi:hypothetical protein